MAVCAANLTFGDFSGDPLPAHTIAEHGADVTLLVASSVVEIKNAWIALAAIDAVSSAHVFD
jgi:hypothetical protein